MATKLNMLAVEGATVSFGGFTVLDNLSLLVDHGELRFLIGPNGAGKTTLLDMLTGKVKPVSGRVLFNARLESEGEGRPERPYTRHHVDITRYEEHQLVGLGMGRKFQTPSVYASLSCRENIEVALGFRGGVPGLFRRLRSAERDRIEAVLDQVGLSERATVQAGSLSHGEKQWLEIGMLLVQDPKLLLLDEPVAGMTRRERDKTGELLHALEGSHTVIVTEHDMAFVRQFSRTVTVLHQGRVIKEGGIDDIQRDEQVREVYLGRAKARAGV